MANVLAARAARRLDAVDSLRIRVGGLPQSPEGPLRYQLVFSVGGLVNEYKEPCLVVRDGKTRTVEPLTEVESIDFAPPFGRLEAFHTSGGLSTLPKTLRGRVRNMDYKTIRYEGHCEKMKLLLDLGFFDEDELPGVGVSARAASEAVLVRALAPKRRVPLDAVLVRITVEGTRGGRRVRIENEIVDRCDTRTGHTAMMRTTAYPAAIVAAMLGRREALREGAVPQENALRADAFADELRKRFLPLVEREVDERPGAPAPAHPIGTDAAPRGDDR
jgi:lysine 6-dehydrogenase